MQSPPGNVSQRRSLEQNPMDTRRYWTDEEEKDAIYNVFLKRIRYGQGSGCQSTNEILPGVAYMEWQTVKVRLLKAGTLEKIVENLISADFELESSHVNIFFDTYREFTTPEIVMENLLRKLSKSYSTQLERPVKQLIFMLLENYPEDFNQLEHDDSVRQIFAHAEKFGDIDLRNRLKQWLKRAEDRQNNCPCEVLEWIREPYGETTGSSIIEPPDYPTSEDLLNYSDKLIAAQLTFVDADLLKRLLPHECLAQERSKNSSQKVFDSVQATICHFNAVCARVESCLLSDVTMTSSLRLRLLIKWIDIAQFLFMMKNFSALNAVISALQAEPVFRLERLWASLPAEKYLRFKELAGIFANGRSEAKPQCNTEYYLGVTREPSAARNTDKKPRHRRSYSDNAGTVHGTIPYLGKYLTDLVMLDTALPESVTSRDGQRLINFDKARKEFEILAQIRLFQSAAASYQIEPHDHFRYWFYRTLPVIPTQDCFNNSLLIEPPAQMSRSVSEISDSSDTSSNRSKQRSGLLSTISTLKRIVSSENLLNAPLQVTRKNSISSSQSLDYRRATTTSESPEKSPYLTDTFCILKISLDDGGGSSVFYSGTNLYKSILVNDCEKTLAVVRSALDKHGRELDEPTQYDLVQVLSRDQEFVIPSDATVFYAINSGESDLKFILRRKPIPIQSKFSSSTLPKSSSIRNKSSKEPSSLKWTIKSITRC